MNISPLHLVVLGIFCRAQLHWQQDSMVVPPACCSACCGTWSEPQNIPRFIQRDTPGSRGRRRTSLIPTLKFMTDGAPCMSFQVASAYMAKGRGELELCLLWGFSYQYTHRVFFPSNSPITTKFQNIRLSCLGWVDLTVSNTFLPSSPLGLIPVRAVLRALSTQPVTLPFLKKLPMQN